MGLYDRDYYRDDDEPVRTSDLAESMVAKLILVNVVIYVIDMFVGQGQVMEWLAVPGDVLMHPTQWWRLLTAAFAHASITSERGIWHIAINMFMLYMFGREMEQRYGSREFLAIYLAFAVGASLIWAAIHMLTSPDQPALMVGASGAVIGIVILFVCNFPHRRFAFPPVPAWVAGIMIVAIDAWYATASISGGDSAGRDRVAFTAHLGGAALAFLYFKSGIRLYRGKGSSRLKLSNLWRRQPKLKVHDPEQFYAELDRRADAILDKVARHGVDSLTAEESRILSDYSRRMRQKHR